MSKLVYHPAIMRALIFCVALAAVSSGAASAETGFIDRVITVGGEALRYQVFVPLEWTSKEKWPVILFLHGAGERGRDGLIPTEVGLGTAVRRDRTRFPAVIVFPQSREQHQWSDPPMRDAALQALDVAINEFNGDPERVYAMGLSMGGQGVIRIASHQPARFAAIVSVCGPYSDGGKRDELDRANYPYLNEADPFTALAVAVKELPIWLFHGDVDNAVPVEQSRKLAAALQTAGANVRYTEYPGVSHNSWDRAFAEPELMPWLLMQRRPGK